MAAKKTAKQRRLQAVAFRDYRINPDHSIPIRGADFLNWLAERAPGRWVKYPDLVKVVMQLPRKPTADSREVDLFRGKMQGIKKHLSERYGRVVIFNKVPGGGFRASVDDDEIVSEDLHKKARRVQSAHNSFVQTHSLVDQRKLRDKRNKDFYRRSTTAKNLLTADELIKKLAPPKKPEDE